MTVPIPHPSVADATDMTMSIEPAQPDAGMTDPETMSLEAAQAELGAYRPGNAAEVVSVEEWMARRMQLWRRLDTLIRPGAGAVRGDRSTG
jgi:hypothetical protein